MCARWTIARREETRAQGVLAFCQAGGAAEFIPADKLAILLAGCKTLRLVLLNTCQGAVTGTCSAFAGVAQRLLQQGTAAVVAMQAPIYDDHALRFSQEFYRALADGLSVEQAVGEGRKRINEVACTWGIPTVYFQGAEPFTVATAHGQEKADSLAPPAFRPAAPVYGRRCQDRRRRRHCRQRHGAGLHRPRHDYPGRYARTVRRYAHPPVGADGRDPAGAQSLLGARTILENTRIQLGGWPSTKKSTIYSNSWNRAISLPTPGFMVASICCPSNRCAGPSWR